MSVALSSFNKYYEQGGFTWRDEHGKEVLLKPYVHMFVGDIAGVNEMIGHYNSSNTTIEFWYSIPTVFKIGQLQSEYSPGIISVGIQSELSLSSEYSRNTVALCPGMRPRI